MLLAWRPSTAVRERGVLFRFDRCANGGRGLSGAGPRLPRGRAGQRALCCRPWYSYRHVRSKAVTELATTKSAGRNTLLRIGPRLPLPRRIS